MAAGASSSSSSSCSTSSYRPLFPMKRSHDVFISFRGTDTRNTFTSHLHEAFSRAKILAFVDYDLPKGDEISSSLLRAIEESSVSVVVFSENYASSRWCLDELVKIMECRRDQGQAVVPVFHGIDPSHVRNQLGSYEKAFEEHEKNSKLEMAWVQNWRKGLTEAANLAGWDSQSRSYRDDSELIQKIVKDVLQKLDCRYPPNVFEDLVGIPSNFAPLKSLLRDVRSVGIWGIGGIGKTTLARFYFERYSHLYEGSCFLEDVQERSGERGRQGLQNLRNQLYSSFLKREACTTISTFDEKRLRRQRNLIVLDDVSSSEQIKELVGNLQSFGPDSRIIITTRDKSVLESSKVEQLYTMKELDYRESLKLFSLKAFHKDCPDIGYNELSRRAVAYCKGMPLALEVLGSFLNSKSQIEWDSALKKLEKIPNEKIQNVLRLSYDGLNFEEQQIFLDIACFLKGESISRVIDLLDNCGFYQHIGLRTLQDKALINIRDGRVCMHDLIQEMGWEIVREESKKYPGRRSRLFDCDDICHVLKTNMVSETIEGIMLDMSQSQSRQNLCLTADAFKKMPILRYLRFVNYLNRHGSLQLPH